MSICRAQSAITQHL